MGVLRENLQPTDFSDAVCRVSPWRDFSYHGYSAVRVWLCRCGGHWFQRHEYSEIGRNFPKIEEWIYSGYSLTRKFPPHMVENGLKILEDESR